MDPWSSQRGPGPYGPDVSHMHSHSSSPGVGLGDAGWPSINPPFGSQLPHTQSHPYRVSANTRDLENTRGNEGQSPKVRARGSSILMGNGAAVGDVDMTSGRCMCCDSTVRWPKNLSVFRCIICRTINDLKVSAEGKPPVVSQIFLDETKTIIDTCVANLSKFVHTQSLSHLLSPTECGSKVENSPSETIPSIHAIENPPYSSPAGSLQAHLYPSGMNDQGNQLQGIDVPPYDENGLVEDQSHASEPKALNKKSVENIFEPLERYISACFTSWECLNGSFFPPALQQAMDETADQVTDTGGETEKRGVEFAIGEKVEEVYLRTGRTRKGPDIPRDQDRIDKGRVGIKSPAIDWDAVKKWYELIIDAGATVTNLLPKGGIPADKQESEISSERLKCKEKATDISSGSEDEGWDLAEAVERARLRVIKVLLSATESLLKRPGRPLKEPGNIRFLLIILSNPLLYPSYSRPKTSSRLSRRQEKAAHVGDGTTQSTSTYSGPGLHSGIIKRVVGLISILPNITHHYLVSWFSRLPEAQFRKLVELGGSFITYRLNRQPGRKKAPSVIGVGNTGTKRVVYHDDWQIRAAARFMALLFSANNNARPTKDVIAMPRSISSNNPMELARRQAQARGQIILTSDFYNMLLDYSDLIADFDSWESRSGKFCFCQYPFLFSMGAKIHILEYDARRQMEVKAREAFFSSLANKRAVNQYLVLKVRRDCLVEDSLKGISEGVGGMGDIKKGLKIEFVGEDGVDAGGLRKEWFLLLVRDVFDPNYGLFVYDEDSRYCYFNPNSFESSEEFFLIGVVFGLAIYNSTILDVALPPVVFKKLLKSPSSTLMAPSLARQSQRCTLDDLAIFRPALARGLRQLLEFEGNVEEVFCRNFAVEIDRFGQHSTVPLIPGGEDIPVTNANRKTFVDKYTTYILDTSVAKQFEPFKRGFYTVCGGNALSLFRPEEIELLVRGSDDPLDISALRAVAMYEGWNKLMGDNKDIPIAEHDPVIRWFWSFFEGITPDEQRLLLAFITGSDRIPAMGATNLVIKLVCMGDDCDRFPVARTCFNALYLCRYRRREKLEQMLWRAVEESEGFGIK